MFRAKIHNIVTTFEFFTWSSAVSRVYLNDKKIKSLKTIQRFEEFWDKNFKGASFGVRVLGGTGRKFFSLS